MSTAIGRYRILRTLGRGGMGTVYLAEHVYLGRPTALKVLHPELCDGEPVAADQFRRGAFLAARINHPGVAQIYDFERTADGACLLAMEYVPGETLGGRLQRGGALPVADVVSLLQALASSLDHAHRLGILHRDLKPENVMLVSSGGVKILDFGIALETTSLVAGETFAWGTPAYMSPEQLLGEPVSPASDVYSLGVLTYEALTARLPHSGVTPLALLADKLTGQPHPIGGEVAALGQAVLRAITPDPASRWVSAGAFARAAAQALERLPAPVRAAAWSEYCLTA